MYWIGNRQKQNFLAKKMQAPGRGQAGRSKGKWGLTGADAFLCWSPNLTMSQVQMKEMPPREEEVTLPKDRTGDLGFRQRIS